MCNLSQEIQREAEARGEARGINKILASLVNDGVLSVKEAAKRAGKTEKEFRDVLASSV